MRAYLTPVPVRFRFPNAVVAGLRSLPLDLVQPSVRGLRKSAYPLSKEWA